MSIPLIMGHVSLLPPVHQLDMKNGLCRNVKIVKLQPYGCFVALNSSTQGLVHVSELDVNRVSDPANLFAEGDEMDVKVLEKNQRGQLRLSR